MSKVAISEAIQKATGCNAAQAKEAVDAVTGAIARTLKKDGRFGLRGFGTFRVVKRGRRKGRNPRTGESITIRASKSVRFKPSDNLNKRV